MEFPGTCAHLCVIYPLLRPIYATHRDTSPHSPWPPPRGWHPSASTLSMYLAPSGTPSGLSGLAQLHGLDGKLATKVSSASTIAELRLPSTFGWASYCCVFWAWHHRILYHCAEHSHVCMGTPGSGRHPRPLHQGRASWTWSRELPAPLPARHHLVVPAPSCAGCPLGMSLHRLVFYLAAAVSPDALLSNNSQSNYILRIKARLCPD